MKKEKTKKIQTTGTGRIGTSRPGAIGSSGQGPDAPSSSNCPKTVHRVDPRPCAQNATGMNQNNINMVEDKIRNKITGSGGIGAPKPGTEELVERDPSVSLSDNRDSEVDNQACPATRATGHTATAKRGSKVTYISSTKEDRVGRLPRP